MRKFLFGLAVSLSILCLPVFGQDEKVARGKYLVEEVARCQDCHTPHLVVSGELVKSAWLKGATLDYVPVNQPPNWRSKTPDITSTSPLWARWGDDGMVKFFETGMNPRGSKPNPPMPAYTLSHDDAVAVAAFLKSLK
jgi:mono/diheme cytochrome c family protein